MRTTILLNGEQHSLVFNNYAMEELGRQFGKDPLEMLQSIGKHLEDSPLRTLTRLVYTGLVGFYGLKDEDCPVSKETVAEWTAEASNEEMAKVFNCWMDAARFRKLLPDVQEAPEAEEKKVRGRKSKTTR